MQATRIQTDETLREIKKHGTASYPFEYYLDEMCALNHHSIDWHWHDEVEWVFARTGNIECSIEADTIQLQTGDGAFINSRALHRFKSDADTLMPNILFSPDFIAAQDSPVFSDYMEPVIFSNRSFLVFRRNQEKSTGILTLLQDIFQKAQSNPPDRLSIQIAVLSLWQALLHEYASAFAGKCTEKKLLLTSRTRKMLQFIADSYMDKISLTDIAASAGISKSEALRCFHRSVQTTPVDYLIQYRIRQAKHLLRTTDDTITRIAGQVGIDNTNYFNRVFRQSCGITPSVYRTQWRNTSSVNAGTAQLSCASAI